MWLISWRDLAWRRRRFVIAVVATGLVFSITLLLSGMSSGFNNETTRTVDAFGADAWILPTGASGPFTTSVAFPATVVDQVRADPGVRAADPMVVTRAVLNRAAPLDVIVFGTAIHGLGPRATSGRDARKHGEAVVDDKLGADIGTIIDFGGHRFRVVGTYSGLTVFGGEPTATVPLQDARAMSFASAPLATSIMVRGHPSAAPAGFSVYGIDRAISDLRRPLKNATSTINFLNVLLWIIAGGIIGSIVYLTVIERTRDFAVLKATGFGTFALFASLALEAVIIALASAAIADVLAVALHGTLALDVEISTTAYVGLAGVAAIVGILASLVGLRRAVGVDPALAFG